MKFKAGDLVIPNPKWSRELIRHIGLEPEKQYPIVGLHSPSPEVYTAVVIMLDGKQHVFDTYWLAPAVE